MNQKPSRWHNPGLALWAGVIFLIYFAILVPIRYSIKGMGGIYDLLWACNVALILAGFGCLRRSPILIGSSIVMVSFAHFSWNLDVLCYYTLGFFPFGTASYVAWPETPYLEVLTTLHHVWFLPLLFAVLRKNGDLPWSTFLYSYIASPVLLTLARILTPKVHDGMYLNVNMAHEWWKDVDIDFLHSFNDSHFIIYLTFMVFICNILNGVGFIVWKNIFDKLIHVPIKNKTI